MVKGKTSLHKPFVLAYLMGQCIDHLEREKEERALAAWCAEALRKMEREIAKWCAVELCTSPLLNII